MIQRVQLNVIIEETQFGKRLDQALTKLLSNYSRSRIKEWILNRKVSINGKVIDKPSKKVLGGEIVAIQIEIQEDIRCKIQDISLHIIYEDEHILVINKSRDLVVHPGIGNPDGTLLNALLHYYPTIADVPRAGIVHRLDKDTTGLMVVAKTVHAQTNLVKSLQLHEIIREYDAVVVGNMTSDGIIDKPINRHITKRTHMAVCTTGKYAVTHYRIIEHFRFHTRLCLRLETGRTHQIRVHMKYINHPIVGDQLYGRRVCLPNGASKILIATLRSFNRQALHACMLRFHHPITGIKMELHASLPQDMTNLIRALKIDAETSKHLN